MIQNPYLQVTGISGLVFGFDHSISVERPQTLLDVRRVLNFKASDENDNVLIVVEDKNGVEYGRYPPGYGSILITMSEVLSLAGISLDEELPGNPNQFQGKIPHPFVRMTGLKIDCMIDSYNKDDLEHSVVGHHGPLVSVRFEATPEWTSRPVTTYANLAADGQSIFRYRYNYGIQLSTIRQGKFSYFDPVALLTVLAVMAVYFHMPVILVSFVARFAMGPLSKIYSQAIIQPIRVDRILAGQVNNDFIGFFIKISDRK